MEIPLEKENQTKLVKFMIRIGVFSVLYLVPLLTVIGCYLYEHTYRDKWETTWMEENCRRYHIPCPYKVHRENVFMKGCVKLLSLPRLSMPHWFVSFVKRGSLKSFPTFCLETGDCSGYAVTWLDTENKYTDKLCTGFLFSYRSSLYLTHSHRR